MFTLPPSAGGLHYPINYSFGAWRKQRLGLHWLGGTVYIPWHGWHLRKWHGMRRCMGLRWHMAVRLYAWYPK